MKNLNQADVKFSTGGDFGSKYLHRNENYELGSIIIPPQTRYAEKDHVHKKTEEVFWFTKGEPLLIVNNEQIRVHEGDVYVIEPNEVHNFINDTNQESHIVFIKSP